MPSPLQWRRNGRDSVSKHQPYDCLLNRLFRRRSKKTSKLRVTGLCAGNSPGTGEFTGNRWIPRTNGQQCGKCFHLMTSYVTRFIQGFLYTYVYDTTDRSLSLTAFRVDRLTLSSCCNRKLRSLSTFIVPGSTIDFRAFKLSNCNENNILTHWPLGDLNGIFEN